MPRHRVSQGCSIWDRSNQKYIAGMMLDTANLTDSDLADRVATGYAEIIEDVPVSQSLESDMSFQQVSKNNPVVKTAAYTANVNDSIILCDTTTATFAVTLPTGATNGTTINIKWKAGASTPTVIKGGTDTIFDGSPINVGKIVGDALTFVSDGNGTWYVV